MRPKLELLRRKPFGYRVGRIDVVDHQALNASDAVLTDEVLSFTCTCRQPAGDLSALPMPTRERARVVLINGSFGVGKTTVATKLRELLPNSAIYDPECTGPWLRRAARWIPLHGSRTDDFQDIALWRRSAVYGTRLARLVSRGIIIVPMTFDNLDYYREVLDGIREFDPNARSFCLTASLDTIRERLQQRGRDNGAWVQRRAQECVAAYASDDFGDRIDTEKQSADDVAISIHTRIV